MSFGGPNQPWQRNVMPFQQNVGQQSYMPAFSQGANFQASGNMYGSGGATAANYSQTYNSIGTVTKINNECGLVNDEVFFYRNACKGQAPKLGDRVLFEATSSTTGQFKWNANRIQLMPPQPLMQTSVGGVGISDHKGGSRYGNDYNSPPRRSSPMGRDRREERDFRGRDRMHRSREREDLDRKRRREELDRSHDRQREARERIQRSREREELERKRRREEIDRSRERERIEPPRPPPIRAIRKDVARKEIEHPPSVRVPKYTLIPKSLNVFDISERYPTLYIPSHFFEADIKWHESFTLEKPFSLRRSCQFHIMREGVEPLTPFKKEELEPNDEDYSYCAKVMLLSCPSLSEIYRKCFESDKEHVTRLTRFLVGTRGNNEPMAIGGAWSQSLDGPNPDKDPAVLIRTAIRTCKALTGIDLSNCTQWYRFCELRYVHPKNTHVETVVIFLPDIHSCMPTVDKWQKLTKEYKAMGEKIIARREKMTAVANNTTKGSSSDAQTAADNKKTAPAEKKTKSSNNADVAETAVKTNNTGEEQVPENNADATLNASMESTGEGGGDQSEAESQNTVGDSIDDNEKEKSQPTHYSKLDLKTMKVQEIRDELTARKLPSKGARNTIMARLAKAINTEKSEETKKEKEKIEAVKVETKADDDVEMVESNDNETAEKDAEAETETSKNNEKTGDTEENEEDEGGVDMDMNDILILDEYDSRKNPEDAAPEEITEKEKKQIRERYTLPKEPAIIVHPNRAAKSGKFDCLLPTLHRLQDHGLEHCSKQRVFEVFLFSRLFKEMLMRDFSFTIYKELYLYTESKGKEGQDFGNKDEVKENGKIKDDKDEKITKEKSEEKTSNADTKSEDGQSTKTALKRKEIKEKEKDKKMITVKPQLLLSFLYFDTNHTGYVIVRDLSELFKLIGINLSRAQTQKMLETLTTRPTFDYRKLTDKETTTDALPTIEDADNSDEELIRKISLGNYALGKTYKTVDVKHDSATETENNMINYKGTVINVGNLMEQINRTEKSYCELEKLYNDLQREHNDLQTDTTRTKHKINDFRDLVKSLTRKLNDANHDLSSLNRKYRDEHNVMVSVYKRLEPFVVREKDKDKKDEKDKGKKEEKDKDKNNKKESSARSDKDKKTDKDKLKEKTKKSHDKDNDKKEEENTSNNNGENNEEELEHEEGKEDENQVENENNADADGENEGENEDDDNGDGEGEGEDDGNGDGEGDGEDDGDGNYAEEGDGDFDEDGDAEMNEDENNDEETEEN